MSTVDRFNEFHLEVGCIQNKMKWIIDQLSDEDHMAIYLLDDLVTQLDNLVDNTEVSSPENPIQAVS